MSNIRDLFQVDPDILFLNHGSFGACPRPVFETYQEIQRELETNPVEFMVFKLPEKMDVARDALAGFLNVNADDLAFVLNATVGFNTVLRSVSLEPGEEILTTNHAYGTMLKCLVHGRDRYGWNLKVADVSIPGATQEQIFSEIVSQFTEKTKLLAISHIASPSGVIFPVKEIVAEARKRGIVTLIDGAHAPGQIDLDVTDVDADFYTGNCHKWICAPKGSAFLHVSPRAPWVPDPTIISWAWDPARPRDNWRDAVEFQGTRDPSAWLSLPAAIEFHREHIRPRLDDCYALARRYLSLCEERFGWRPAGDAESTAQLGAACVTTHPVDQCGALQGKLWWQHRMLAPATRVGSQGMLRISCQVYNTADEIERYVDTIEELLRGEIPKPDPAFKLRSPFAINFGPEDL